MEPKRAERAHDLATRIYVELVSRNTEVAEGSVKMSATAANLATLSLRLAEVFLDAEAQAIIAREPTKNFSPASDDIASWST